MPRSPAPRAAARSGTDRSPTAPPAYAATGARLGRAVLVYMAAVVLVITLQPFTFAVPARVRIILWPTGDWWRGPFDVVTNVALFLPLGFVAALTRSATRKPGRDGRARVLWALGGAALLSTAIEFAQVFEHGRYPSPTDVISNAAGGWLGAWLHARSQRHLGADSALVGRLALELPVMGLVYVLLPLLTLAGITAGAGATDARAIALVALAGLGGALLGTVQRRQFGPRGNASPAATAVAAAAWFAAGALPAVATAPRAYAAGTLLAASAAWAIGRPGVVGVRAIERRFEGEALGRAAPWLAAYLALLPLGDAVAVPWGRLTILRDLEVAAGFTAFGYVLAEAWGRREWRFRQTAWVVALAAAATAGAVALLGAAVGTAGRSGTATGLLVASACGGAWLYHLQRAHVRALVAARGDSAGRPTASHAA